MKRLKEVYILILVLTSSMLYAQQLSNDLKPGYTTFGLNAGKAYQSSDVRATPDGFGFGMTLGKNLYYRPQAPLSFDIRSRFLYARSKGLDALRNYKIENNSYSRILVIAINFKITAFQPG